ncbi:MAG: hypothetical protein WA634_13095 [Silvibacterium sp.]
MIRYFLILFLFGGCIAAGIGGYVTGRRIGFLDGYGDRERYERQVAELCHNEHLKSCTMASLAAGPERQN